MSKHEKNTSKFQSKKQQVMIVDWEVSSAEENFDHDQVGPETQQMCTNLEIEAEESLLPTPSHQELPDNELAENSFITQLETIWTITTFQIVLKLLEKCLREATRPYDRRSRDRSRERLTPTPSHQELPVNELAENSFITQLETIWTITTLQIALKLL